MSRLDAGFRVDTTTNQVIVAYPSGAAPVGYTIASGYYATAVALAAAVQTAIQGASVNLTCTIVNRTFYVASAGLTFDISVNQRTLREWWSSEMTGNNVQSVAATCVGSYVSRHPWPDWSPIFVRSRKLHPGDHGRVRVVGLAAWREWHVRAQVHRDELEAWRSVVSYLVRGQAFTVYLSDDTTAWTWTNYDGRLHLVLTPAGAELVERWLTRPHQTWMTCDLIAREVA